MDTAQFEVPQPSNEDALREELAFTKQKVEEVQSELRSANAKYVGLRHQLQDNLLEVDDEDEQNTICEFLNGSTPWDFDVQAEFEVTMTIEVRVMARNEYHAQELVGDSHVEIRHPDEGDMEVTDTYVRS